VVDCRKSKYFGAVKMNYKISVMTVENKETGNVRFYKECCDTMTRISKHEYDGITDQCDGMDCFLTSHRYGFLRQYKACIFYNGGY